MCKDCDNTCTCKADQLDDARIEIIEAHLESD